MKIFSVSRAQGWSSLLTLALLPVLMYGSWLALKQGANEVSDWLPEHYSTTIDYQWFRQHFTTDEFILISWDGCTLDDPRVDALAARLQPAAEVGQTEDSERAEPAETSEPPDGPQPLADADRRPETSGVSDQPRPAAGVSGILRVITGRSLLDEMTTAPISLPRAEAIDRLKGSVVGPDGRQTCVIVELTSQARAELRKTLQRLQEAILASGVPEGSWHTGGSPIVNAAMDEISIRSMGRAILLTCSLSVIIAWFCIRDVRLTLLILVTGLLSMAAAMSMLPLCGVRLNATLFTMVPMVQTASVSGALHLCNYYRQAVAEQGHRGAAWRAVRHAWLPLALATGTTAAGLLSICHSDLQPIRQFGLFSAIGVGLSFLILMIWLPLMLSTGGPQNGNVAGQQISVTGDAPLPPYWQAIAWSVIRRYRLMTAVCLGIMLLCAPGLQWFHVAIDLLQELPDSAAVIQDCRWLEEHLGHLTVVELILRIPDDSPMSTLERVQLARKIQQRIAGLRDVGCSMSVASFVPVYQDQELTLVKRSAIRRQLERKRERLLNSGFLVEADGEELWRISVRVASLNKMDYGQFAADLPAWIQPELESERCRGVATISTGVSSAVYSARRSLMDGLVRGLVTDVLLICVAVMLMLRNFTSALLMVFSNLFPTCLVLGIAGCLNLEVYAGTILAPCVALGVTVDDVIHLVIWYRNGVRRGQGQTDALNLAWQACARPMYQSWALLGLGMATLLTCELASIRQFGMTMIAMLSAGLVGNLVLVPALLAGWMGRMIQPPADPVSADR